jgi:hypothetical protein
LQNKKKASFFLENRSGCYSKMIFNPWKKSMQVQQRFKNY